MGAYVKVNRHGKAKILTHDEIQTLFNDGLNNLRDRVLFSRDYRLKTVRARIVIRNKSSKIP